MSKTGVCFGTLADELPSMQDVVALYDMNGIRRMRLYDPNRDALTELRRSGQEIELMLGVPNTALKMLAEKPTNAVEWVENNVKNFDGVNFRYIAVGNGVSPWNPETQGFVEFLLPAMRNVRTALQNGQLADKIKVSTALDIKPDTGVLKYSTKPSECSFKANANDNDPWSIHNLLNLLGNWRSPLLVNIHPYHFFPSNNNLNYALFQSAGTVVRDGSFEYKNLFDALLDSVYVALDNDNRTDITIVVSETGWPTTGGSNATTENAQLYNNNLIQHVKTGTPRKPRGPIEAYIYAMFDENQKQGREFERHWGIFLPDQTRKYAINFN